MFLLSGLRDENIPAGVALVGGEARPVRVEAHVGRQSEAFKLSGLPDTAVREAKAGAAPDNRGHGNPTTTQEVFDEPQEGT